MKIKTIGFPTALNVSGIIKAYMDTFTGEELFIEESPDIDVDSDFNFIFSEENLINVYPITKLLNCIRVWIVDEIPYYEDCISTEVENALFTDNQKTQTIGQKLSLVVHLLNDIKQNELPSSFLNELNQGSRIIKKLSESWEKGND